MLRDIDEDDDDEDEEDDGDDDPAVEHAASGWGGGGGYGHPIDGSGVPAGLVARAVAGRARVVSIGYLYVVRVPSCQWVRHP